MSVVEWIIGLQGVSMACGFISFIFTIGIGYFLINSLKELKDE